jgi:predicted small integral membrane protein
MKKLILSVILYCSTLWGYAQTKDLPQVSIERIPDTDSIWISLQQTAFVKAGTLMVVAKAMEAGVTDTLYYPVIDTLNSFL